MSICPTCGRSRPGKPRSLEHHRRLFGLVKAAWEQWPHGHREQFDDPEQLRKWLLLKAGYFETYRIELADANPVQAVIMAEAAMKAAGAYARAKAIGSDLIVFRPKSIAFDKLSQHDFSRLSDQIEAILRVELGVEMDQLLKHSETDHGPQERHPDKLST